MRRWNLRSHATDTLIDALVHWSRWPSVPGSVEARKWKNELIAAKTNDERIQLWLTVHAWFNEGTDEHLKQVADAANVNDGCALAKALVAYYEVQQ